MSEQKRKVFFISDADKKNGDPADLAPLSDRAVSLKKRLEEKGYEITHDVRRIENINVLPPDASDGFAVQQMFENPDLLRLVNGSDADVILSIASYISPIISGMVVGEVTSKRRPILSFPNESGTTLAFSFPDQAGYEREEGELFELLEKLVGQRHRT